MWIPTACTSNSPSKASYSCISQRPMLISYAVTSRRHREKHSHFGHLLRVYFLANIGMFKYWENCNNWSGKGSLNAGRLDPLEC